MPNDAYIRVALYMIRTFTVYVLVKIVKLNARDMLCFTALTASYRIRREWEKCESESECTVIQQSQ